MINYTIKKGRADQPDTIWRSDGWSIPINPDNTDYQQYLKWVEAGNTPLPADGETSGAAAKGAA